MKPLSPKLDYFLKVFENEISTYYEAHEKSFDLESFHGRFHILRCLFLVDKLDGFYASIGLKYDVDKAYYAVLFHDIAREGNGIDEWEEQSATRCYAYLISIGKSEEYAQAISRLILKEKPFTLEGQLLYDVDVLDYNRFFTFPFYRHLFDEKRLMVGSEKDCTGIIEPGFRRHIIRFAQDMVSFSERISVLTPTKVLLENFRTFYQNH